MIRGVLTAEGFTVRIDGEASAAMLDGYLGLGRFVRIEVPADEAAAAKEAILAARQGGWLTGEEE